jgi:hypothetical protein
MKILCSRPGLLLLPLIFAYLGAVLLAVVSLAVRDLNRRRHSGKSPSSAPV